MFTILMERKGYISGLLFTSFWKGWDTFRAHVHNPRGMKGIHFRFHGIQSRVHVHDPQGKNRIHFRVTFITFTILMEEMGYILAFMVTIL
jgi:hypothetical protein